MYSDPAHPWTQYAFYHLYNHMTGPGGSGQIHLLFPPAQVFIYWGSSEYANLATSANENGLWLYPGDATTPLPAMTYFPYLQNLIDYHFDVMGKKYLFLKFQKLLDGIFRNWNPLP